MSLLDGWWKKVTPEEATVRLGMAEAAIKRREEEALAALRAIADSPLNGPDKLSVARSYLKSRGVAPPLPPHPPPSQPGHGGGTVGRVPDRRPEGSNYETAKEVRRKLGIYLLTGTFVTGGMEDDAAIERALVLSEKIEGAIERIEKVNAAVERTARQAAMEQDAERDADAMRLGLANIANAGVANNPGTVGVALTAALGDFRR